MNRSYLWFLLIVMLSGCGSSQRLEDLEAWKVNNGKIKVLATTEMIAYLVRAVGGEHVDTLVLITGELDPHTYELVKGDDEKLGFADIVFFNGLGLEHGSSLQHHLYNHPHALSLGDKIRQSDPAKILVHDQVVDPHLWMDVSLWSEGTAFIVSALSERAPTHAQAFEENGRTLSLLLQKLHTDVKERLSQVPDQQRYLVTSHDAFNYFARAYLATESEVNADTWQERVASPEGLAPDSQLNAADIQQTIDYLVKHNIHVVFPESNVNGDSIRKIVVSAKAKNLDVWSSNQPLYADAMGKLGSNADNYMKMIQYDANLIADFLMREKERNE